MAEMNNQNGVQRKSVRGFAAMDAEKQREIARKGGRAAHEQGVAHEWSSQEAREAGKKRWTIKRKKIKRRWTSFVKELNNCMVSYHFVREVKAVNPALFFYQVTNKILFRPFN